MKFKIFTVLLGLLLQAPLWASTTEKEPVWTMPWQQVIVDYLKSTKLEDFDVPLTAVKPEDFDAELKGRYVYLITSNTPLLSFMAGAIHLKSESFLWKGGIWRPELEAIQKFLMDPTRHGLSQGQFMIPSHPNVANILAYAYANEEKWNPYHQNPAVAKRAAVISMVDLLGWMENDYYYRDKRSSYGGRRWGIHSGVAGFSLTFQAFTHLKTKAVLPEKVQRAWDEGLLTMCRKINKVGPTGPMNMRFSIPVGYHYAYLSLGGTELKGMYDRWVNATVFSDAYSMAGHHWEGKGRAPDGSYNGIALHRLAELASITKDPNLIKLIRESYRLKSHMCLPKHDGTWISASHFNDRCQSGFANDQYQGRETQFVTKVPEAVPFLRHFRNKKKVQDIEKFPASSMRPSGRISKPFAWGAGSGQAGRMHDWANVMHVPDSLYHEDEVEIQKMLKKDYRVAVLAEERFDRNFGNEFYFVRRPAYYASFYTGSAVTSDDGATNYRSMLKNKGGLLNGFGGGGLSALWTPAGTFMIGRMTAYENYQRDVYKRGKREYVIPGWQDWATHQLVGITKEDKVLSNARTSWPESQWNASEKSLLISGKMLSKTKRQGQITPKAVGYKRYYRFDDEGFTSSLEVSCEEPLELKRFYEAIPLHITDDLEVTYRNASGELLTLAEVIKGVSTITLKRSLGSVNIHFPEAQTIERLGQTIESRQATRVYCRSIQVRLANKLGPQEAVRLDYRVTCHTEAGVGIQVKKGAESYPEIGHFELPDDLVMAHFKSDEGLELADDGSVTLWRDLSKNGFHLKPFDPKHPAHVHEGTPTRVRFDGKTLMFHDIESFPEMKGLSAIVVGELRSEDLKSKNHKYARLLSVPSVGESDSSRTAFSFLAYKFGLGGLKARGIHKSLWRHPTTPTAIGLGRSFGEKEGAFYSSSFGLKGDLVEVYFFAPILPSAYQKHVLAILKERYGL